jgi:hypothetical protein
VRPTRACLHELLAVLDPVAERLGAGACMPRARELVEVNGALAQRAAVRNDHAGPSTLAGWLASQFLDPVARVNWTA